MGILKMAKPANAKQSKLLDDITELINEIGFGFLYGDEYQDYNAIQRHHVVGRSAKHNKTPIGHEFVIPVPYELHDVLSNHKDNVTHYKKRFVDRFGTQRSIYAKLIEAMVENGYAVPDTNILEAIQGTIA